MATPSKAIPGKVLRGFRPQLRVNKEMEQLSIHVNG